MSGSIQAAIYNGYGVGAKALQGNSYGVYRASGAANPIAAPNLVATLPAVFDTTPDFKLLAAPLAGKNIWYVLVDGTQTKVGDYLVGTHSTFGNPDTWFISAMYPLQSIQAIQCNATLTVYHPEGAAGFGSQPYGGTPPPSTPILTAWPGSVVQGTKGEKGDSQLPRDVRMPWFSIFLPAVSGVTIQAADVIADTQGRRFEVSSAELTPAGWRLTAILAQT